MIEAEASLSTRGIRLADRALAASLLTSLALAGGAPKTAQATPAHEASLSDCVPYFDTNHYRNHEGEVCTAYLANSAEVALQGFYKFGNNRRSYESGPARHHFRTRYYSGPRQAIERDVDSIFLFTHVQFLDKSRVSMGVGRTSATSRPITALILSFRSVVSTTLTGTTGTPGSSTTSFLPSIQARPSARPTPRSSRGGSRR